MSRRLWALTFVLTFALSAQAQRRYWLGTSINLTGGGSNSLNGFGLTEVPTQSFKTFYGGFPTITLTTEGEHSMLDAAYSYGYERSGKDLNQQSHSASLSLSKTLNPRWTTSLSESFESSSNAFAFNALRNVFSDPTTTIFVFSPVTSRITPRSNSASLVVSDQYTDRSSLSFSLSHHFLHYGSVNGPLGFALENQQGITANIGYDHQSGPHETWTLGYNASYFGFAQSENAFSQTAVAGYSNNIFRDFKFSITAGISETQSQGSAGHSTGLNSSVSLGKTIGKNNSFQLHYSQTSGGESGLGTISNLREAGVSLNHVGRHTSEFVDASAFDSHGILGNALSQRAAMATASFGLILSRQWSAQVGGTYQAYDHSSTFGFTQKSAFVSLRYANPNLWTRLR